MSTRNRNRLPDSVEPDLPPLEPGEEPVPINAMDEMNGVSGMDYDTPEDIVNDVADQTEVRRAEPTEQRVTASTMDTSFISRINDPNLTEEQAAAEYNKLPPALRYVYDRTADFSYNNAGSETPAQLDPRDANRWLDEFYEREAKAKPEDRAGQAVKRADAAVKQVEFQQSYLQELQYQRHIATLNDKNSTRAQRAAAINAIDGLATSIGQRMIKGTSTAAVADAKRLVGTVSSRLPVVGINVQEYNPAADYGPQLETMLSGSQERMGVLRQQMEAAGIPMPEAKQVEEAVKNPPAPSMFELSVQRLGVKGADGSQVMLNGAPVIRRKDGKMFKAMPNGKGVELTAEEISQLGL